MTKIGKILFIITLLSNFCFAAVAYFQKNSIQDGDRAVLIISAKGKDIKFPDLQKIGGFDVVGTSQSQNIQNINGNVTRSIQKAYTFYPSEDITLQPLSVTVDGNVEKTKSISLHVIPIDTQNAPYSLSATLSKIEPYQNEGIVLSFILKIRKGVQVSDLRFSPPNLDGFWVKEGQKEGSVEENGYIIQKINYLIFPQKSGVLQIPSASIDIGVQNMQTDMFGMPSLRPQYKRIHSQKLLLHVKPLNGAKYVGNFKIGVKVDKTHIKSDERVNVTLKIEGYGNFDDISNINLHTSASVFADKPSIKTHIDGSKLVGKYVRKFSLSSDSDFTINPVKFTYFDEDDGKIKTIQSETIHVSVEASKQKEKQVFLSSQDKDVQKTKKIIVKENSNKEYLLYGFVLGVALCLFIFIVIKTKKSLHVKRKYDEKMMLKKLFSIDSLKAKEYIKQIEEYLYGTKDTLTNKKEIERFIKSYEE